MPRSLLSIDDFREAAKDGSTPDATVYRYSASGPLDVTNDTRTKSFVFSEGSVDLANDAIAVKGWDTTDFKRNPVALFSHASWEPPIGRAKNVRIKDDKLVGDIEFASADVYPFADTIYRLVDGGFLKAVSVGFKPLEWSFTKDKNRPYGIDFKRQKLLEISLVPIPCNPNALSEARSIGIDTRPLKQWAERVLDSDSSGAIPRRDLEALRTEAGGMAERKHYVAQLKQSLAASSVETREDRMRAAADLKRSLGQPLETPTTRLLAARDLKRELKAKGLI